MIFKQLDEKPGDHSHEIYIPGKIDNAKEIELGHIKQSDEATIDKHRWLFEGVILSRLDPTRHQNYYCQVQSQHN